ncbi:hypothetical protein FHG87_021969 [Trinorchestia longiramus]|nr:hypothetical protein FHG87_021969 [Trinorchestia longiramus]
MESLHKGPNLMISMTPVHKLTAAYQLERVKEAAAAVERASGRVIGSITDNHKVNQQYYTMLKHTFNRVYSKASVSQSGPYRPPGGVEEMQGGGRRVRLEWGAYITV